MAPRAPGITATVALLLLAGSEISADDGATEPAPPTSTLSAPVPQASAAPINTKRPSTGRAYVTAKKVGTFSYDYSLFSIGIEGGTTLGTGGGTDARGTVGPELAPIRYGLTTQSAKGWILDADVKAGSFYLDLPGAVTPGFETEILRSRVGGSYLLVKNRDPSNSGAQELKCAPAVSADFVGFAYSRPGIDHQLAGQDGDTAAASLQAGPSWICNNGSIYFEAMPFFGAGGATQESDPTDPDAHLSAGLHAKLLRTSPDGLAATLATLDAEHRWSSFLTTNGEHRVYDVRAAFDQRVSPRAHFMLGGEIDLSGDTDPETGSPAAATAKLRASYAW